MTTASLIKLMDFMRSANDRSTSRLDPNSWTVISHEVAAIQQWLKKGVGSDRPSHSQTEMAIRRFKETLRLEGFGQARLACYGIVESVGPSSYKLIEDGIRFSPLLNEVDRIELAPRLFRRCYRGLLSGYFLYDKSSTNLEIAKRNWELLREYLEARLDRIPSVDNDPEWIATLRINDNLVSREPCAKYAASILGGDDSEFERICTSLNIDADSWLIRESVRAQVSTACEMNDAEFYRHIPSLLTLIERHQLLLDESLARILDRVAEGDSSSSNDALRDYSVQYWGNPWLTSNAAKWGRVQVETKQMVVNWLKKHFIKQFFSLLSEDGSTDDRRLRFWERYHGQIDDMYFALGPGAMQNQRRDFKALRHELRGRSMELTSPGSPNNNAFIMKMKGHFVVEFGVKGNACFIFKEQGLPFSLVGSVSATSSSLKHTKHIERLVHIDRNSAKWEDTFEGTLHHLIGVRPQDPQFRNIRRPGRSDPGTVYPQASAGPMTGLNVGPDVLYFSDANLLALANKHGYSIIDSRSKGGARWISAPKDNWKVAEQLKAWGFRWSDGRKQWYLKD